MRAVRLLPSATCCDERQLPISASIDEEACDDRAGDGSQRRAGVHDAARRRLPVRLSILSLHLPKLVCLGLNYHEDAKEAGERVPSGRCGNGPPDP